MLDDAKKLIEKLKTKFDDALSALDNTDSDNATGSDNMQALNNIKHTLNKALTEAQSEVVNLQIKDPNLQQNVGVGQVNPGMQTPVTPGNNSHELSQTDKDKIEKDKKDKAAKENKETAKS